MPMSIFGGYFSLVKLLTDYYTMRMQNTNSTAETNWLSESEEDFSHFFVFFFFNVMFLLDCLCAGASQKERGVWQG